MRSAPLGRVLIAVAAIAPMAAIAAADRPSYKEVDRNGDGEVSVSEAIKVGIPEEEARREDIDSDGILTRADWQFVDMAPSRSDNLGSSNSTG